MTIRPVGPGDEPALRALLERLSPESRRLRFFEGAELARKAGWAASQGAGRGFGLVALAGGRVVGHAAYVRDVGDRAELAIEVEDALQGRGIGSMLLRELIAAARSRDVRTLTAIVRPENARMAALLNRAGFVTRPGPAGSAGYVKMISPPVASS